MSAISNWLPTPPDNFSTTLSSGISTSDLTIPLNSVSGLPTEGVGVLFTKDSNGDVVAGSVEFIHWTNVSGSNLTLTNTGDRGITGSDAGAQSYSAGAYFEVWVSSYYYDSQRDGFVAEHSQAGVHDATIVAKLAGTQTFTGDKTFSGALTASGTNLLSGNTIAKLYAPQGFLINGKISVTDTGSGLTVAIKTLAGTDPSSTDPVYCRIGDTVRSITAALSVTKADGTNWCNAGGAELATKESDYFVYLGYNATDGVVIGFSRIPYANVYGDFSATTTNEKYCAISTITNAASTDYYEVIGRFAATLSAGAGYTWSVPTYTASNLIQRPIYETRWLTAETTWGGFSVNPSGYTIRYKIKDHWLLFEYVSATGGTSNSTAMSLTLPFSSVRNNSHCSPCFVQDNGSNQTTLGHVKLQTDNTLAIRKSWFDGSFTAAGGKDFFPPILHIEI